MTGKTSSSWSLVSVDSLAAATQSHLLVRSGCLTIGLMSDLHTEEGLRPEEVPCPDVDVWIAAGDIATQTSPLSSIQWLDRFSRLADQKHAHRPPVLFVPGNHDFFHGVVSAARARWAVETQGTSVCVLENEERTLAGVRFLGTPLWSDLSGVSPRVRPQVLRSLRTTTDCSSIETAPSVSWTMADMVREHAKAYRFLAERLTARAPGARSPSPFPVFPLNSLTVVATHFAPHLKAHHPRFIGGVRSSYFVNHHPELCHSSNLWVFGHTHSLSDFVVGDEDNNRARMEESLLAAQDRWTDAGGLSGVLRDTPLFDSAEVRQAATHGRFIAHPHGHKNQHVPGMGLASYVPLVLCLFPDGHVERRDGR